MELLKPTFIDHGIVVDHNMPCPVHLDKPAVLNTSTGRFDVSWQARQEGWRLVQAKTKFQKWLLKTFLGARHF